MNYKSLLRHLSPPLEEKLSCPPAFKTIMCIPTHSCRHGGPEKEGLSVLNVRALEQIGAAKCEVNYCFFFNKY